MHTELAAHFLASHQSLCVAAALTENRSLSDLYLSLANERYAFFEECMRRTELTFHDFGIDDTSTDDVWAAMDSALHGGGEQRILQAAISCDSWLLSTISDSISEETHDP